MLNRTTPSPWKGDVLPLHQIRIYYIISKNIRHISFISTIQIYYLFLKNDKKLYFFFIKKWNWIYFIANYHSGRTSFKIVFNSKIKLAIIISPFQKSYNDKVSFRLDTMHKMYMGQSASNTI